MTVKDFSFNRDSRVEIVGRETLNPTQDRTVAPHIAAISPVNFTFTTYVLPTVDTNVTSPEEYLWVSLMGEDTVTSGPTESTIDFADGNVPELQNLTLWFNQPILPEGNFRIDSAVIDSAKITFDINKLPEIEWSGQALNITLTNSVPQATDYTSLTGCIKNKLSTISVNMNNISYNLALTGGSITYSNNVRFYGRNKLGKTYVPTGHVTGNRKIDGELSFYMKSGSASSVDLFGKILGNAATDTYESTYSAAIDIDIGGISSNPKLTLSIPAALLQMGRQNFNEVISVNIPFTAQEENNNYSTITYTI